LPPQAASNLLINYTYLGDGDGDGKGIKNNKWNIYNKG
jgi:hypothetical protein